jgi:putative Mg2+ transporter-C (MgtC) family protein
MSEPVEINWNAFVPLLAAVVLSGIVGIEREIRRKPAGLRTNILIGLGAALFTSLAETMSGEDAAARIIQGIVTGVGFIGAGVLMRQDGSIHGTTTAATIWLVTGIGVACGMRCYETAGAVTVMALIILWGLSPLDKRIHAEQQRRQGQRNPDD